MQKLIFVCELVSLIEDSEKFEPKLKSVMEDITHYVQEEGEMLPKVEKIFDTAMLKELGKKREKEKRISRNHKRQAHKIKR